MLEYDLNDSYYRKYVCGLILLYMVKQKQPTEKKRKELLHRQNEKICAVMQYVTLN